MQRYLEHAAHVVALLLASMLFALPGAARSQAFPSKPLRLVVPFPAGGPTDIVARPLAQILGDSLGQSVIVDNRGGAGGSIGADAVAKSSPDGYTLLMGTVGTSAINAALYRKLPHDPVRDFTPIALVASAPVAVVVNPAAGFGSIKDLIAQASANPGKVGFGSAGNGTPGHLTGEMFAPAGLPTDVTEKLRREIERIVRSDAFRDKLGDLGVVPSVEAVSLADFQKAEVEKWGKAVRASGAVVD